LSHKFTMQIVRQGHENQGAKAGSLGKGTKFRVGLCKFYDINKNVDNINFTSGSRGHYLLGALNLYSIFLGARWF